MNLALRAEAQRFTTTRSTRRIAAVAVAYGALGVGGAALAAGAQSVDIDANTMLQFVKGTADVTMPAAMILGILATAGEYRHGTIVPSLLAAPRRDRFVATKVSWQLLLGATVGALGAVLAAAVGWAYLASEDATVWPGAGDVAATVAAVAVVTAIYGAIGAGVGLTVRNQSAALAGALVWMFAIEEIVPVLLRAPGVKRWLLDGAAGRILDVAVPRAGLPRLWSAVAVLAVVTVAATAAAVLRTSAPDVD